MKKLTSILFFFSLCYSVAVSQPADSIFKYKGYPEHLSYDLVKDQISCIEDKVPLTYHKNVHSFVNYFAIKNRSYTQTMIDRQYRYFPIFERKLRQHNLPDELKYLSIIESGLNPLAISRAKAAGLWQFMPATGKIFKLHQDWFIDERLDPEKSTEAACKYLKQLYGMFSDWGLALAAYNSGPGNVRKAIRKSGYKGNFWEIYKFLPRETRAYVPQYVAIVYVLQHADQLGFDIHSNLQYEVPYDTIMVSQYTHLTTLSSQLNMCDDEIIALNPSIRRQAIPELKKGSVTIKIPRYKYQEFTSNRKAILDSASKVGRQQLEYLARNIAGSTYGRTRISHKVRKGDVLGKIAMRYSVRVNDIKKWNKLRSTTIRVGQRLKIWIKPAKSNITYVAMNKKQPSKKQTPTKKPKVILTGKNYHTVQQGDTLWDIARKYDGLTIAKIKSLNKINTHKIKPGQNLIIGEAN